MIYGYARVSPDGQSVEAQVAVLTAARAVKVYREIVSGAKTDWAQLRQVLARLTAGDVLLGTRLDRLARSTRALLNTLAVITGTGAGAHPSVMPGQTPQRACHNACSMTWGSERRGMRQV